MKRRYPYNFWRLFLLVGVIITNVMGLRIRSRFDQIEVVNQRNRRAPRDPA